MLSKKIKSIRVFKNMGAEECSIVRTYLDNHSTIEWFGGKGYEKETKKDFDIDTYFLGNGYIEVKTR